MNNRELLYFVTVVDDNSITRAAKKLYVSQPAVSLGIKELESEFKTKLFTRHNNVLTLTESGRYLYSLAKPLARGFQDAEEKMRSFVTNHSFLKVGIPPMLGTMIFPPFFEPFSKYHSNISMKMTELGSIANQDGLIRGDIDVALMIVEPGIFNPQLDYVKIGETQFVFACDKKYPLSKSKQLTIEDVRTVPLILLKEDSIQYKVVLDRFKALGLHPNVRLLTNQLYTITELLKYGDCGAFLFPELIDEEPNLVGIPLSDPITFDIVIAYKKGKPLNPSAKVFLESMAHRRVNDV